jgi:hypothetical protein
MAGHEGSDCSTSQKTGDPENAGLNATHEISGAPGGSDPRACYGAHGAKSKRVAQAMTFRERRHAHYFFFPDGLLGRTFAQSERLFGYGCKSSGVLFQAGFDHHDLFTGSQRVQGVPRSRPFLRSRNTRRYQQARNEQCSSHELATSVRGIRKRVCGTL